MKKLVLALLVLMMVTGYSFADDAPPTPIGNHIGDYIPNGCPSTLVRTYRVGISVDRAGAGVSVIDNISVTAVSDLPVQLSLMGMATPDETYLAFMGANAMLDTHILTEELKTLTGSTSGAGNGWTEDNDLSLESSLGPGFGKGALYLADGSSAIALNNYDETYPDGLYEITFLQVVVPFDETVCVSGRYTNPARAALALDPIPFSFCIFAGDIFPEPSTIVMLVLGALCVAGIRLRRKSS